MVLLSQGQFLPAYLRSPNLGIPWRREWLPTAGFSPGESHGQRSLVGYSPWSPKQLDRTEWLTHSPHFFSNLGSTEKVFSSNIRRSVENKPPSLCLRLFPCLCLEWKQSVCPERHLLSSSLAASNQSLFEAGVVFNQKPQKWVLQRKCVHVHALGNSRIMLFHKVFIINC